MRILIFFYCRPFVSPVSATCEKIFCRQRNLISDEATGVELGKPLPGSDAVEASRRRYIPTFSCMSSFLKCSMFSEQLQRSNTNCNSLNVEDCSPDGVPHLETIT